MANYISRNNHNKLIDSSPIQEPTRHSYINNAYEGNKYCNDVKIDMFLGKSESDIINIETSEVYEQNKDGSIIAYNVNCNYSDSIEKNIILSPKNIIGVNGCIDYDIFKYRHIFVKYAVKWSVTPNIVMPEESHDTNLNTGIADSGGGHYFYSGPGIDDYTSGYNVQLNSNMYLYVNKRTGNIEMIWTAYGGSNKPAFCFFIIIFPRIVKTTY